MVWVAARWLVQQSALPGPRPVDCNRCFHAATVGNWQRRRRHSGEPSSPPLAQGTPALTHPPHEGRPDARPGGRRGAGQREQWLSGPGAGGRAGPLQVRCPLDDQAPTLVNGGGIVPFAVTPSSVMAAPTMTFRAGLMRPLVRWVTAEMTAGAAFVGDYA